MWFTCRWISKMQKEANEEINQISTHARAWPHDLYIEEGKHSNQIVENAVAALVCLKWECTGFDFVCTHSDVGVQKYPGKSVGGKNAPNEVEIQWAEWRRQKMWTKRLEQVVGVSGASGAHTISVAVSNIGTFTDLGRFIANWTATQIWMIPIIRKRGTSLKKISKLREKNYKKTRWPNGKRKSRLKIKRNW